MDYELDSVGRFSSLDTIQNQSLTQTKARTEARRGGIEKARIGAYRLVLYGTFYGTVAND
jgi:hypothetical protein